MKSLRALESTIVRVEGAVAVALVLTMLVLAGYNVCYRNLLVPLQKHWAHSGPPIVAQQPTAEPIATPSADGKTPAKVDAPSKSAAEGFGGDWGEGDDDGGDEVEPPPAKVEAPAKHAEAAEGFGGDWGEGDDGDVEDAAEPPPAKDGKAPKQDDATEAELLDEEDPFANLSRIEGVGNKPSATDEGPQGGPPPEGSFAAWGVAFIDSIKLDWIDVVLRQLVILVAFFGGMLATHRGKHINVDALSKLLGSNARRLLGIVTNALAVTVCVVLARAGSDLVAISHEHPRPLVPWADEWVFQLMYPFGWSMLAFHFGVRLLECAAGLPPPGEAPVEPITVAARPAEAPKRDEPEEEAT
ncbi:MAG TPA: TRAP transporter small permease [Nannocystaceae bacterium]|nr:TRAP transporter small permease [Nannocystaceae bacterium]